MDERMYFNLKDAARFLGYAPRTFQEYVRQYRIPRVGPRQNRFSRRDLESFMENPQAFIPLKPKTHNRPFKPVQL